MRISSLKESESKRSSRFVEVIGVRATGGYRLQVSLTDGSVVERDLSRFVEKHSIGVRSKLRDARFFRRARPGLGTVVWSRDVDICPYLLIWQKFPTPARGRPRKFAVV